MRGVGTTPGYAASTSTASAAAISASAGLLYAFAQACAVPVVCLARVTNRMAQVEGDFGKGDADRSTASLAVSWRDAVKASPE